MADEEYVSVQTHGALLYHNPKIVDYYQEVVTTIRYRHMPIMEAIACGYQPCRLCFPLMHDKDDK